MEGGPRLRLMHIRLAVNVHVYLRLTGDLNPRDSKSRDSDLVNPNSRESEELSDFQLSYP